SPSTRSSSATAASRSSAPTCGTGGRPRPRARTQRSPVPRLSQGTRAARTPRSRAPETPTARRQATETPTARPATESSGCIPSSVSQVELSAEVPPHGAVGGGPASRGCRRRSRLTGLSAEVPPHGAVGGGAGSPLRAQLQAFGLGILGQVAPGGVTVADVRGQQRAGQLVADLALDQATQRTGAEGRIVAFEGQPVLGPLSDLE